jgi:hypothetical protein
MTKKEYIVNVGNIGNIQCKNKKEALKTFNEYVRQSKAGYGRAGEENVCIIEDGEPSLTYDFNWLCWIIRRQAKRVGCLEKLAAKETEILNNLIERQEQV